MMRNAKKMSKQQTCHEVVKFDQCLLSSLDDAYDRVKIENSGQTRTCGMPPDMPR